MGRLLIPQEVLYGQRASLVLAAIALLLWHITGRNPSGYPVWQRFWILCRPAGTFFCRLAMRRCASILYLYAVSMGVDVFSFAVPVPAGIAL